MSDDSAQKQDDEHISVLTIQVNDTETKIRLRENEATIFGRIQGDVILDDTEVSSSHCQIHYINGAHHIFDMNSTNGTFVNGERIIKYRLSHNDIINVGRASMLFQRLDKQHEAYEFVKLVGKKIHSKEITRISDKSIDGLDENRDDST